MLCGHTFMYCNGTQLNKLHLYVLTSFTVKSKRQRGIHPERKAHNSPRTSVEIKHARNFTSITRLHGTVLKHWDNFTLTVSGIDAIEA
jgi:hypothetical protein